MNRRVPLFPGLEAWDAPGFLAAMREVGMCAEVLVGLPVSLPKGPDLAGAAATRASLERVPPRLAAAIRLFSLGDWIGLGAAMDLLGWRLQELHELGFVETDEKGNVRSRFELAPMDGSLVAVDFPMEARDPAGDFVMGLSPSTRQLAALVPPGPPGRRVLEVGCGIGWLARRLAAAGDRVTATDINPRALALARFNSRLSGVESVDWREGSLFDPVAGEEPFDLIVSNPPYVVSPDNRLVFREAGPDSGLCRELVEKSAGHLAPGGIAVAMLNWGHESDDDWSRCPLDWVRGSGMQAWLFQSVCQGPEEYALSWLRQDPRYNTPDEVEREVARWAGFLRSRGMNRVSGGFIALRCPLAAEGGEWARADSRNAGFFDEHAGSDVGRVLRNEAWLHCQDERAGPSALLDSVFAVPDGVRATVDMGLEDTGWARRTIRVCSPGQLSYDGQVDESLLRLLELCRKGEPPRAMVDELASDPRSGGPAEAEAMTARIVGDLLRFGLLSVHGLETHTCP